MARLKLRCIFAGGRGEGRGAKWREEKEEKRGSSKHRKEIKGEREGRGVTPPPFFLLPLSTAVRAKQVASTVEVQYVRQGRYYYMHAE